MQLKIYQVDAFANKTFEGNPAAIVPLESWLDNTILQAIANENNLSETAYIVPNKKGYDIRWLTPTSEVDMCGHATLASAYVLFNELGYDKQKIYFDSKSGELIVQKEGDYLCMDFPAQSIEKIENIDKFKKIFGDNILEVYKSMDYIVVFKDEEIVKNLKPDISLLKSLDLRGVIITSKSSEYDFVCRFFAPNYGIEEDPVTGSAFTQLVTYWNKKLDKISFNAKQVSSRGGEVACDLQGDRCIIKGKAVKYLEGTIEI
jgi:PhzF family phenazine biosynthesis protein